VHSFLLGAGSAKPAPFIYNPNPMKEIGVYSPGNDLQMRSLQVYAAAAQKSPLVRRPHQ
jgi:hypothetical protein